MVRRYIPISKLKEETFEIAYIKFKIIKMHHNKDGSIFDCVHECSKDSTGMLLIGVLPSYLLTKDTSYLGISSNVKTIFEEKNIEMFRCGCGKMFLDVDCGNYWYEIEVLNPESISLHLL
jgi:hypothetical protein